MTIPITIRATAIIGLRAGAGICTGIGTCVGTAFALLFIALLLFTTQARAADDAIIARGYLKDEGSRLTLQQAMVQPFTPFDELLAAGYQDNASYWLRLTIKAGDEYAPPYVLRIRPTWHDEIQLFDPADASHPEPRFSGDRYSWSAGEIPTLSHAFLLKKTATQRDVYLRIRSIHTYMVAVQALEPQEAELADRKTGMIFFGFLSFIAMALLWAIVNPILRPDPVMGAFAAYLLLSLPYCLFLCGFGRIVLDGVIAPRGLDYLTTLLVIICTFAGIFFHRVFLHEHVSRRLLRRLLDWMLLPPLLALALFVTGDPNVAVTLNASFILIFSVVTVLLAWFGISSEPVDGAVPIPHWLLRLFYSLFFMVGFFGSTPLLGWMHATEITLHIFLAHIALSVFVMTALLGYRARKLTTWHIEQLAMEQQKTLQERQARVVQGQFMAMLNHELKTPLSVLKLLVANQPIRAQAESTIDSITRLIDRCIWSDRLENGLQPMGKTALLPAFVINELIQKSEQPGRFVFMHDDEPKALLTDPAFFSTIASNLLDNGLKYAPPRSQIEVRLREEIREGVRCSCLSVTNDIGRAGVPDSRRLFEKYYRADGARSVSGTGLGLYLVKALSGLLGGSIDCQIDESRIRFTLCLPY